VVLLLVNWKKLLWGCTLFVAFFSTLFFTVSAFQKRISSLDLAANQERVELWKVGWKMFQDSPWFGQGYDSFGYRLPQFSDLHITSPSTPLDPHNMYLEFLATSGILGFLCFLLFLGASFRLVFGKIRNSASPPQLKPWFLASAGVLTAFSVGGFFDRYFDMPHTMIPLVLMLGLCTASKPDEIVADV
jgi:O-antigen ligase